MNPKVVLNHAQEARLKKLEQEAGCKVVGHIEGDPIIRRANGSRLRVSSVGRLVRVGS